MNQKHIGELLNKTSKLNEDFKNLKNEIKKEIGEFMKSNSKELLIKDLPGKRTPKIVKKLFYYPGDISPAMLEALMKEIKENKDFYHEM